MNIKLLKKVVDEKGYDQKTLAKKCHVAESTISRVFNEVRSVVSVATASKIVKGLGIDSETATKIFLK